MVLIVPEFNKATCRVLDDLGVRRQRMERTIVESAKDGIGDVADARLQEAERTRAGGPPFTS